VRIFAYILGAYHSVLYFKRGTCLKTDCIWRYGEMVAARIISAEIFVN